MSSHPPGRKNLPQKRYAISERARASMVPGSSSPSLGSRLPQSHTSFQHQNKPYNSVQAAVLQTRTPFTGVLQPYYPVPDVTPANATADILPHLLSATMPPFAVNQAPPPPSTIVNSATQMSHGIAEAVLSGLRNHPREILDGLETRLAPHFDTIRSEIDAVKTGLRSFKDELSDMKEEMLKLGVAQKETQSIQLKMIDGFQTKVKELENVIGNAHSTDMGSKDTIMGRLNEMYYALGDVFEKMADDEAEALRPEPRNSSFSRLNRETPLPLNRTGIQANATPGPSRTKSNTPQPAAINDEDDEEEEEDVDMFNQPSVEASSSSTFMSSASHPTGSPAKPSVSVSPQKPRPHLRIQTENLAPKINTANIIWPPALLQEQAEHLRKEAEKNQNAKANQDIQDKGKGKVNENQPLRQAPSLSITTTNLLPFQHPEVPQVVPPEILKFAAEKSSTSLSLALSEGSLNMELRYPMSADDMAVDDVGVDSEMRIEQSASAETNIDEEEEYDEEEESNDEEEEEESEEKEVKPMDGPLNDAEDEVVEVEASENMEAEEEVELSLEPEVAQEMGTEEAQQTEQEEQEEREKAHEEEHTERHEKRQVEKVAEIIQEEKRKDQQMNNLGIVEQDEKEEEEGEEEEEEEEEEEDEEDTGVVVAPKPHEKDVNREPQENITRFVIRELSPVDVDSERDNHEMSDSDDSDEHQEEEESEENVQDGQSSPVVVTMLDSRKESPLFLPDFDSSSLSIQTPTQSKEELESEESGSGEDEDEDETTPVPNPQESGNNLEITSLNSTSDSTNQSLPIVDVSQFTQSCASQTTVVSQSQGKQDDFVADDNGEKLMINTFVSRTDSTSSAEAAQVLAELTTLSEPESSEEEEEAEDDDEEQFDELASDGLEPRAEYIEQEVEEMPAEVEKEMESIEEETPASLQPRQEVSESIQSFSTLTQSLNAASSGSPIQSFSNFAESYHHEVVGETEQPPVAESPKLPTAPTRLKTPTLPINRPQPQIPVTPVALPTYLSPVNSPVATPTPNQVKARKRKLELEGMHSQTQPQIRPRLSLDKSRSQSQSQSTSKEQSEERSMAQQRRTGSSVLSSLTPLPVSVAGSTGRPSKEVQKKVAVEPIYISSESEDEVMASAPTPTQAQTQAPSRRGSGVFMECIDLTDSPEKKVKHIKKISAMSAPRIKDPDARMKEAEKKKRVEEQQIIERQREKQKQKQVEKEKEKEKDKRKLAEKAEQERQDRERKKLEAAKKKQKEKKMLPIGAEDSDDAEVIPAKKFKRPRIPSEEVESEGHSSANLASSSSGHTRKIDLRKMVAKQDANAKESKASTKVKRKIGNTRSDSSGYQGSNRDDDDSDEQPPLKRARIRKSTDSRASSHVTTESADVTQTPTKSKGKGKEILKEVQSLGGVTPMSPIRVKWPSKDISSTFHQKFIGCDMCKMWFHYGCVGIQVNDTRLNESEIFICPICTTGGSKASWSQSNEKEPSSETTCDRPDCGRRMLTDNDEYFVKRIIGRRGKLVGGRGRVFEWLVEWDGYSTSEATWEKERSMGDPKQLIETFIVAAEEEGLDLASDPNMTVLLRDARKNGFEA